MRVIIKPRIPSSFVIYDPLRTWIRLPAQNKWTPVIPALCWWKQERLEVEGYRSYFWNLRPIWTRDLTPKK